MTPVGRILAAEIEQSGPIPFRRFMTLALYHPEHGYYRRARPGIQHDPFGRDGDFYTAAQLQPVFGRLIRTIITDLRTRLEPELGFRVVDLGAGRAEMRPFLEDLGYLPVDYGDNLPASMSGVVFANEFFDALPVDVEGRCVGFDGERFVWTGAASEPVREVAVGMEPELKRIAGSLRQGFLFIIDYGYTERESVRFPAGSLMSYRRHVAVDDVLQAPGEQDITAHVPFTELLRCAEAHGFILERFETLAQALLRAGEPDEFGAALSARDETEALRLRLQLKTLLFGMGETFRCALLRKA